MIYNNYINGFLIACSAFVLLNFLVIDEKKGASMEDEILIEHAGSSIHMDKDGNITFSTAGNIIVESVNIFIESTSFRDTSITTTFTSSNQFDFTSEALTIEGVQVDLDGGIVLIN